MLLPACAGSFDWVVAHSLENSTLLFRLFPFFLPSSGWRTAFAGKLLTRTFLVIIIADFAKPDLCNQATLGGLKVQRRRLGLGGKWTRSRAGYLRVVIVA